MPDQEHRACQEQQRLMERVQDHLLRIAELSRSTAAALADSNENMVKALDQEVEKELGRKERALGALRQHRSDHGC